LTAYVLLLFGLFFLGLAAHPYTIYPLSLFLMRRRQDPSLSPSPPGPRRTVAICMSAYNEERVIVEKVEALLAMAADYGPATIHIYVDGAQDRTAELLSPYADRVDLVISSERRGKTAGLNMLLTRSDSELLLFTDANVRCDPSALARLEQALQGPDVVCATCRLVYSNPDESSTSGAGGLYWKLEEAIKRVEGATIGVIGVDGALFLAKRSAYEPAPDYLIDDLYVSLVFAIDKQRVVSAPDVLAFERSAVSWREEFRRKARIACQGVKVHQALWPRLSRMPPAPLYGYLSHRPLKWAIPFTLVLSGLFFGLGLIWLFGPIMLAVFALALVLTVVGGLARIKPFGMIGAALLSLAGVGAGVLEGLFTAKTYTTWMPAESVRSID